jgi:hypothetical protein
MQDAGAWLSLGRVSKVSSPLPDSHRTRPERGGATVPTPCSGGRMVVQISDVRQRSALYDPAVQRLPESHGAVAARRRRPLIGVASKFKNW